MNLARALALKSGDVLVAVNCGRASVPSGGEFDYLIRYECGDRVYVTRSETDSPEVVRIADGQPLGRVDLRNWEPVTRCDYCFTEGGEHELKECERCGVRRCWECGHTCAAEGRHVYSHGLGRPPRRQKTLTFKLPNRRRSK